MRKFLNCLKETGRTLRKGEQGFSPKLYSIVIFVAFFICVARFVHDFIKRIAKRENQSLRMKRSNCSHQNRIPVNKIFIEQNSPETKVKVSIPICEPLEASKCKNSRDYELSRIK